MIPCSLGFCRVIEGVKGYNWETGLDWEVFAPKSPGGKGQVHGFGLFGPVVSLRRPHQDMVYQASTFCMHKRGPAALHHEFKCAKPCSSTMV